MTAPSTSENTAPTEWPPTDSVDCDQIRDLPPSAKLVAWVLAENWALPPAAIADRSPLPRRTVRYGFNSFKETELLIIRPSPRDARKQVNYLPP